MSRMPQRDTAGVQRRLRRGLRSLIRLRGSPRAIAGGVAVGVVVAFSPTMGIQTALALGLATLLGVNRPVAIVPVWITNPVTLAPIYAFTYYVGSFFWPGPEPRIVARAMRETAQEVRSLDLLALPARLGALVGLGVDVFIPLVIGGLLVGGLAAAVAYPVTLRVVTVFRDRRARRRERRREERRRLI